MTTFADAGEVHPAALVTVKLYVPVARPVIVLVAPVPAIAPGFIVQLPAGSPLRTTEPVATVQVGWGDSSHYRCCWRRWLCVDDHIR